MKNRTFISNKNVEYIFTEKSGFVNWEKVEKSTLVIQSKDKIFK